MDEKMKEETTKNHFCQVLHVPKLTRTDFESWLCTNPLQKMESLIIFKVNI